MLATFSPFSLSSPSMFLTQPFLFNADWLVAEDDGLRGVIGREYTAPAKGPTLLKV
jgi:hypothetical protein